MIWHYNWKTARHGRNLTIMKVPLGTALCFYLKSAIVLNNVHMKLLNNCKWLLSANLPFSVMWKCFNCCFSELNNSSALSRGEQFSFTSITSQIYRSIIETTRCEVPTWTNILSLTAHIHTCDEDDYDSVNSSALCTAQYTTAKFNTWFSSRENRIVDPPLYGRFSVSLPEKAITRAGHLGVTSRCTTRAEGSSRAVQDDISHV